LAESDKILPITEDCFALNAGLFYFLLSRVSYQINPERHQTMTKITMIPVLQYPWMLESSGEQTVLVCYGMQDVPGEQHQKIDLDNKTAEILRACDGKRTLGDLLRHYKQTMLFYTLMAEKIVVDLSVKKTG